MCVYIYIYISGILNIKFFNINFKKYVLYQPKYLQISFYDIHQII